MDLLFFIVVGLTMSRLTGVQLPKFVRDAILFTVIALVEFYYVLLLGVLELADWFWSDDGSS